MSFTFLIKAILSISVLSEYACIDMLEALLHFVVKIFSFCPIAKQPLFTTKANLERSGMGFTIMESFMDEVEISSVVGIGTKIIMKKKIKKIENTTDIKEECCSKTIV